MNNPGSDVSPSRSRNLSAKCCHKQKAHSLAHFAMEVDPPGVASTVQNAIHNHTIQAIQPIDLRPTIRKIIMKSKDIDRIFMRGCEYGESFRERCQISYERFSHKRHHHSPFDPKCTVSLTRKYRSIPISQTETSASDRDSQKHRRHAD